MGQAEGKCTLAVGGTVVLVAREGPLEAEYALFDGGDIELHATAPGQIREMGYRTTVGDARARLADAGFTPEIAQEATVAAHALVAKAYARGAAARCVVDRLESAELFEARAFDAGTGGYQGTWLDLADLATDLRVARAAVALRALHLAASLAELADDAPVFLDTSEMSALRRAGERSYRRVNLGDARALVDAIAALKPVRKREGPAVSRRDAVGWLRERAERLAAPASRERLAGLEALLWAREAPTKGPLAETALWNVEAKLARGETAGIVEQIDTIEKRRGRVPGTIYLRARAALVTKTEEPKAIAERVSALSTSMSSSSFNELQLLAAQSWLAAGDARRARAFARDLVDNAAADDVLRMQALEVLEAAGESSSGNIAPLPRPLTPVPPPPETQAAPAAARAPSKPSRPPAATARGSLTPPARPAASEVPTPRSPEVADGYTPREADVAIPRAPLAPSGVGGPGVGAEAAAGGTMRRTSTRPGLAAVPAGPAPVRPSTSMRTLPPGTSLPPYRIEPRGERVWSVPPPQEMELERAETLSIPAGIHGEPPPPDEAPRTASAARLQCTMLARELGRELRARFGVDVRTDVEGLELAQRSLREALVDGRVRTPEEQHEVMRHGAFLSELLARRLGARWVDLESSEPGRWAMLVPSRLRSEEVARIWPFARVLRFVAMGHRERDLVSYYLELEARSR